MPTYTTDYDWWIATSSRRFRSLGTQLTAFNNAFVNHKTLSACNAQQITTLDGLYSTWIRSKGGTAKRINTHREPQATELRIKMVNACGALHVASQCTMSGPQGVTATTVTAPVSSVPLPSVRGGGGPMAWVNVKKAELDRFNEKNYGVADAAAFDGDIAPGKRDAVLNKLTAINKTNPSKAWTLGDAGMPSGTEWREASLRSVYRRLTGSTPDACLGVCTSFAKAAAYVLTEGREQGPRVELVGFRGRAGVGHVFVIVGRDGGYANDTHLLPDTKTWGAQTVIVDAWLGAMGYPVIFTLGNFPKKGYLTNTSALMIRDAS